MGKFDKIPTIKKTLNLKNPYLEIRNEAIHETVRANFINMVLKRIFEFGAVILDSLYPSDKSKIDIYVLEEIIENWASKSNVHLYFTFKDDNVRSFDLNDKKGNKYKIWIEMFEKVNVKVVVKNIPDSNQKLNKKIGFEEVEETLNLIYSEIKSWNEINN